MMTDPIADMLTRLRNGSRIERPVVDMPATKLKARVAQVLKDEGYILDYQLGKLVKGETGPRDAGQARRQGPQDRGDAARRRTPEPRPARPDAQPHRQHGGRCRQGL